MGRGPSEKEGLKKGPWTAEEDQKLIEYIKKHGYGRWGTVPKGAGLNRCGKSCRLRWTNYLRPDIKRGKLTFEEEETIIQLHSILGNKWSAIAARLPGRTDNEIKNYWNAHIRKRLLKMGIDPVTHKPRLDLLELYNSILNSSLISSSPQVNFQNLPGLIQTSLNSNLLNLITSLALSQCNNGLQYLPQNLQVLNQDNNNNLHVQNQFQPCLNPLVNQAPSTDLSQNSLPNIYQHELQEESMFTKVMIPVQRESGMAQNLVPVQDVDSGNNDHFDYSFVKLLSDDEILQNSNKRENNLKYGFGSVKSTPTSSSTPVNSSTTFVNGSSCADDEKDSYCSNIMSQISHPLDLDKFLCNQL